MKINPYIPPLPKDSSNLEQSLNMQLSQFNIRFIHHYQQTCMSSISIFILQIWTH